MNKMFFDMALGSVATITVLCFLNSKDGKKMRCKIAKLMDK